MMRICIPAGLPGGGGAVEDLTETFGYVVVTDTRPLT